MQIKVPHPLYLQGLWHFFNLSTVKDESISQFMGYLKGKSALTGISLLTFVTVHSYLVPVTDFADASHSKSAKSAATTVSYGIFSSENAYL